MDLVIDVLLVSVISAAVGSLVFYSLYTVFPAPKPSRNSVFVRQMIDSGFVRNANLGRALLQVDRRHFVDSLDPYAMEAQDIGFNATISSPDIACLGLDLLCELLYPGASVLDIGFGSGFTSAVLASVVAPNGFVCAVDHIPEFVDIAKRNVSKENRDLLDRIFYKVGDGRTGVAEMGPYDAIYGAAAAEEIPVPLLKQLKTPGRLLIPVGPRNGFQRLCLVDMPANGGLPSVRNLGSVRFVPMTDPDIQVYGEGRLQLNIDVSYVPAPDTSPEDIERIRGDLKRHWAKIDS